MSSKFPAAAGLAACLLLASLAPAAFPSAQPSDDLQKWLAERAVPVRTLDASDEDFRDLPPLIAAIGSARIVQLGEPTHGAGSSFAAKVRLTRFLHQRMGFDVVAWESGFYTVHLAQEAMRSADDGPTAAQKGVLAIWSWSEEVRPLFDYVKASQLTRSPLEMAGFDLQVTASKPSH